MPHRWRAWTLPLTCAVAFVALVILVTTGAVDGLDARVRDLCIAHQTPRRYLLARDITDVFSPLVDAVVVALGAMAFAWRRRRAWPVIGAAVTGWLMVLTVITFKHVIARPGPQPEDVPANVSFPSGHTAAALVCYGILALLVAHERPASRWWLVAAVAGITATVGGALIFANYHWLTDIVGSVLLGGVFLPPLDRWIRRRA